MAKATVEDKLVVDGHWRRWAANLASFIRFKIATHHSAFYLDLVGIAPLAFLTVSGAEAQRNLTFS